MAAMKNVVLAYDDSAGAQKALQLTKELTRNLDGIKLFVGHVYEEKVKNKLIDSVDQPSMPLPIASFPADGLQVPPLTTEQGAFDKSEHAIITHSTETVFQTIKSELESLHMDSDFSILEGNPAESILEYAKEVDADLIIIGKSGNEGIKRKLLGGVSQKVASHAHCHVLIAK
ncbi:MULTISPECIES: universal stress protein [Mesobacillus]|uniref:Nucleotide-binding universal stress UspA family protein n=1 Tax=Mesobacillus stamsii TaxID=225347 RepID=A0ABU0FXM2_9BACI|nr:MULTISPECIES: universal stress protein [Mesobacillus]MDQ0414659.1 nucleotide-binding universal stress UspA family protein [Mesobacillus stamsii]